MLKRVTKKVLNDRKWFAITCALLFALSILLTYSILGQIKTRNASTSSIHAAPKDVVVPTNTENKVNFVLLGHGGAGHQAGDLMDSIILVSADTKEKKVLAVTIPRDLFIEGRKMNEGFVAGGYDLIKHQVNVVTGVQPDHYVSIDFDRFVTMINILGGVDAKITKPYEDRHYPIRGREVDTCGKTPEEFAELHQKYSGYQLEIQFECRYEHIKFDPGTAHMDGATALKYVRSRHGDGDFGRSERQLVILAAIKDKVMSLEIITKFGKLFEQLFATVKTNLGVSEIQTLAGLFVNPDEYKVTQIQLTDANVLTSGKGPAGQFILMPRDGFDKWTGVQNYIQDQVKSN